MEKLKAWVARWWRWLALVVAILFAALVAAYKWFTTRGSKTTPAPTPHQQDEERKTQELVEKAKDDAVSRKEVEDAKHQASNQALLHHIEVLTANAADDPDKVNDVLQGVSTFVHDDVYDPTDTE
jgi:flagellar biosynthesis/type III secretory pathway M-ring protein FliF/YscJ